ncbi:ATP-binding protein [Aeromicrobium piscarium]|uniref:ATP-binding protein n=1 Tax=Aeromicrobium piscarium TaxID=2590901 RepID=A0A554S748_9ACTN|nr:ATP-binding protein [Aeromicrobium piscarium]TSD62188.1 ATP-binding protein [Aeromicrobium piscarium]
MSSIHVPDDPCTTIHLAYSAAVARRARALMHAELVDAGVREAVIDDAVLVLSELVANAVEHGHPDKQGRIEVSWCIHEDYVRVSVHDSGQAPDLRPLEAPDDAVSGRGLTIVDYICRTWDVDHDSGLRITAELDYSAT